MIVFSLSILILFMVFAAPTFIYYAIFDILRLLQIMSRFIHFFFIVWLIGGAYYFIAYIVGRIQIYGYLDNKKINKSNTPYFKDVPCNDVFYAAGLIGINTCSYEKMNIIGAVLLYWIKNNKIKVIKNNGEIFLQFVAPLPFEGR